MMGNFKSGFVSLIGKTNSGKSTLLNSLVGTKVAITTYKTQTTRTAIKAIINRENSQIIVTDTPGIHKGKSKLSKTMIDTAYTMIGEVDCVLFLIDASEKNISSENEQILDKIRTAKKPTILVINKVDLIPKEKILQLIETYQKEYDFASIVPVSALKSDGTEEVIQEIEKLLPEGPKYYDEEEYTDQTMRSMAEEVIREKALKLLNEEIPHGIFVEVQKFESKETTKGEPFYNIEANIYCLRESHKGIIIGKGGEMLKKISTYARQDLERMFDCKVNLRTWVKVKEDWINSESIVNQKFKLK
ncbi:MAG: GTPase Era [Clostridia bacterium]|nr:GTPase Era [Clostridia bacterium]